MDIDGVFSGGGIKGLALIGAFEELEAKGFTFKRIAGTSAGSIIAALVAAGYKSSELKSLANDIDLSGFLDTRKTWLPIPFAKWLFLYWRLGLYRGRVFEDWLSKMLAAKGVYTFADLPKERLRVVASDLTNGKLLVLPDNLVDLGVPIDSFPVARAIRMSCSIPYFFEPVKLKSLDGTNIIVDGAVLSNFPMWLFVGEGVKKARPVIGISLSSKRMNHRKATIKNGFQLFGALFDTMKDAHDTRYISRQIEKDIIFIPTDDFTSTEFTLTTEKKDALIELGRFRTKEFLKKWTY
ncbi:patatin-like phospholipase family protein [Bacillus sp. FJAT-49736]|uniref:patatin-like phospholipase family protein n=1 Tax=Bacillus sp. FJAT-49736 TaxID=2833582 RepID=UPI001BCA271E|nr:patatin-like phospholipase family protein [Bacillus sp. FJAT-49736]MBS4173437.1 patatin-like phospholipase family protein [Bacillus sp. FJAT-49736]